ncbi:MAG: GntR family transcriptional regulator [Deltaproteobacteria bacterium]|nr:GntR family transcriptional regulator [Deltaproteobacteria bacterium]
MEIKAQKLIDNPNLRNQIYKILKNMIITREILPGKKISEEKLAQVIGVSRPGDRRQPHPHPGGAFPART